MDAEIWETDEWRALRDMVARFAENELLPQVEDGSGVEAAMAKNTAVFACDHVTYEAVQIFGGTGYMRGTEVERHFRDARVLAIGGGATEVMNELIARSLPLG